MIEALMVEVSLVGLQTSNIEAHALLQSLERALENDGVGSVVGHGQNLDDTGIDFMIGGHDLARAAEVTSKVFVQAGLADRVTITRVKH